MIDTGLICDANYSVTFTKDAVIIYIPEEHPVLMGWREAEGPRLWRMSLLPDEYCVPDIAKSPESQQ